MCLCSLHPAGLASSLRTCTCMLMLCDAGVRYCVTQVYDAVWRRCTILCDAGVRCCVTQVYDTVWRRCMLCCVTQVYDTVVRVVTLGDLIRQGYLCKVGGGGQWGVAIQKGSAANGNGGGANRKGSAADKKKVPQTEMEALEAMAQSQAMLPWRQAAYLIFPSAILTSPEKHPITAAWTRADKQTKLRHMKWYLVLEGFAIFWVNHCLLCKVSLWHNSVPS